VHGVIVCGSIRIVTALVLKGHSGAQLSTSFLMSGEGPSEFADILVTARSQSFSSRIRRIESAKQPSNIDNRAEPMLLNAVCIYGTYTEGETRMI